MSHHAYSIAGELPAASVPRLKEALASLGAAPRIRDEISLAWEDAGVDVNFEAVLRPGGGVDYLITGSLELESASARAWVQSLAAALDRHAVSYRLELDDPDDLEGEPLLTLTDPRFGSS
ncbi:MAG: hypothetical protein M3680_17335 [Myxococcota bacterium]|nr:hypothetical protein [Myxococcota bacterium]